MNIDIIIAQLLWGQQTASLLDLDLALQDRINAKSCRPGLKYEEVVPKW